MIKIKIVLCLLLLVPCCSKDSKKIYRTAIGLPNLEIYPDPNNPVYSSAIMDIPFKSKVEIIDNKVINRHVKIKYKDTIGYVSKGYLSEKDDIPFIDDIKYNLSIHEFDYDKKSVIETLKKHMLNDNIYKKRISYYYTDDPQTFSTYGYDCDAMEIKIVSVIINSKIDTSYTRMISFKIKNNKIIHYSDLSVDSEREIKESLEYIRYPGECHP